jgi:hypothetical protein
MISYMHSSTRFRALEPNPLSGNYHLPRRDDNLFPRMGQAIPILTIPSV